MKKKSNYVKKKGFLFKIIAFFIGLFHRRTSFLGMENVPNEPCVFVCNHSQANTPIMAELYFPFNKLTWCDAPMFDKKELKNYAYSVFWGGKPKWFNRLAVRLLAPLVSYVFCNADALPVYRDMRIVKTYKSSVTALENGNSILILPECPEQKNEIINEFNKYFVDLARYYFKSTGKQLLFVPTYYAPKLRKAIFGAPVKFDSRADIQAERERVCDYLMDNITLIAKQLPAHTVIPFNRVSKKQLKKSK